VSPWESTWEKSQASMVDAGVCRNCRQVVSVSRTGAGGIRPRCRTRRMVDAPTRWPSFSNSPWILLYPQLGFSLAMLLISSVTASETGGRPTRCGYVHFLATRRRCQRRIVPGVTTRCPRSICGNLPTSAARIARSAPVHPRPRIRSPQDGNFVAQQQELDVLGRRRTAEQQQQVQQPQKDQVKQTQRHEPRSCPDGWPHDLPGQRRRPTSGTPQVAADARPGTTPLSTDDQC
jgi:hypothetical protein